MKRIRKYRHYFPSTKILTSGMPIITFIQFSTGKEEFWEECIWLDFIHAVDQNGVEIYEGDIVEHRYGRSIVEWDETQSGFMPFTGDINIPFPNESTVIGNVFKNPELIYAGYLRNYLERQKITL